MHNVLDLRNAITRMPTSATSCSEHFVEALTMSRLLSAAKRHYAAKRDEAIANLEVYFTKAVGIGEHSDLQEEIRKWTDVLSNSVDGLEVLEKHFSENGSPTSP
jgi:hypothetical protein